MEKAKSWDVKQVFQGQPSLTGELSLASSCLHTPPPKTSHSFAPSPLKMELQLVIKTLLAIPLLLSNFGDSSNGDDKVLISQ